MKLGSGPGQSSKGTGINGGGTSTGSGGQTQSGKHNTLQNITKCLTITQITKVPHQISKLKAEIHKTNVNNFIFSELVQAFF